MIMPEALDDRRSMYTTNRLKLGFFGANCSSGRFVTTVPERWSGTWDDILRLALLMDEARIEFFLPIARWKGYGGTSDYQGSSLESITLAAALLAATQRMTIFGTVHAPLFPPLIAAKQIVTADHAGHGRFGLNVVCGWNEDEFEMFGVTPGDHASRYRQGQEWLDVVKRAWQEDDFNVQGEFFQLRGVRENPKPWSATRPLIMNAGSSDAGRSFALRNCDAWFTSARLPSGLQSSVSEATQTVRQAKSEASALGRSIEAYTVGALICRPTRREALEYHQYVTEECADWEAVGHMVERRAAGRSPSEIAMMRKQAANGHSGLPMFGSPDDVTAELVRVAKAGFDGIALSLVNYLDELPYFRDEVLPRLERAGLRDSKAKERI
jgi:FMNH2-dependent dimethyl sulfone monooxygenase